MKKTFSLLLILILVISINACSNSGKKTNDYESMKIIYLDNDYYPNPPDAREDYLNWAKLFNERFNTAVELIPKLTGMISYDDLLAVMDEIINETNSEGIVILPVGLFSLLSESRAQYFLPIDDSVYNNSSLFDWPPALLDYGMNPSDGKLWCIPVNYYSSMNFRSYNKKLFDELGIEPPRTLETFKGALELYKSTYDKEPLYVDLSSSNPFSQFSDVFSLYGIDSPETIVYDFETEEYRNIINMEGAVDAIRFIGSLFADGLITTLPLENGERHTNALRNGNLFSAIIGGPYTMTDDSLYHYNLDLYSKSIADTERDAISHVAVILKDTENGSIMMNDFIRMFLCPGDEYLAAAIGFEGINYTFEDSRITPIRYPGEKVMVITNLSDLQYDYYGINHDSQLYQEYKKAYGSDRHKIQPYYLFGLFYDKKMTGIQNIDSLNSIFTDVFSKISEGE